MKERKGISLIVLIVTIIVMIIIAGAIIISLSNTNIIDQAESATSNYNLKIEKEKIQLALNEWLLEKNTSLAPKTFKAFMTEALPGDTISGTDEGPITIKIKDTGNEYKVTKDGEITIKKAITATALEIYLFGEDMQGKDYMSLFSESETNELYGMDFIDDDTTEINEREVLDIIMMHDSIYEAEVKEIKNTETEQEFIMPWSIKYEDSNNTIYYKIGMHVYYNEETEEEWMKTYPEYGIVKVFETAQLEGTDIGKVVSYDNKLWTIMYDDETNGLQMICNQAQLYNGAPFELGTNTSSITDWNTVLSEADLDNSGELTEFEKVAYSYNNAVDILNVACESLVSTNPNILDVRCVGSNPVNKELENETLYTSDRLASIPQNNTDYTAGFANGKLKGADAYRETDLDRLRGMEALGIYNSKNIYLEDVGDEYDVFLASRYVTDEYTEKSGSKILLGLVYIYDEFYLGSAECIRIEDNSVNNYKIARTLLPVVKLNPNIQFSGAGTIDSPYTF